MYEDPENESDDRKYQKPETESIGKRYEQTETESNGREIRSQRQKVIEVDKQPETESN